MNKAFKTNRILKPVAYTTITVDSSCFIDYGNSINLNGGLITGKFSFKSVVDKVVTRNDEITPETKVFSNEKPKSLLEKAFNDIDNIFDKGDL